MNTQYQEKIINLETNEVSFRDYTSEEIARLEKLQSDIAAISAERAAKAAARQALLDRLGITAEEAQLLLGSN